MFDFDIKYNYETRKVIGRSQYCPRKGYYKFVSFYHSTCLGKEALMAKVKWKECETEPYSKDLTFDLQIESFKKNDIKKYFEKYPSLIDREICVSKAVYNERTKLFSIVWQIKVTEKEKKEQLDDYLKKLINPRVYGVFKKDKSEVKRVVAKSPIQLLNESLMLNPNGFNINQIDNYNSLGGI